jgi:hypothetical protein
MEGWMTEGKQSLRWSVERRLEFIEFRLFWLRCVRRPDLEQQFSISPQQASADISRYLEMAPENIRYDAKKRSYVATPAFSPRLYRPDSESYLEQLRLANDGRMKRDDLWMFPAPMFDAVAIPMRRIDPNRLQALAQAINAGDRTNILYQSVADPEPAWRWISPHAFGFDGARWYIRALCHMSMGFRDFLLSRILDVGQLESYSLDPRLDREWSTEVTIAIAPHPDLSPGQRTAVEIDYGMQDGRLDVTTRLAFVDYVLRRLGLDADSETTDPRSRQFILLNEPEIDAAFVAMHKVKEA